MSVLFEYVPDKWDRSESDSLPIVSIVMTTYNQKHLSIIALKSLFSQDYPNTEIIICDDSSSDGTAEALLKECQSRLHSLNQKVILIKNKENLGILKNYEKGFKLAKGELVVTMGGDDISYNNRVSRIVEEWLKTGKRTTVIFHKLRPISLDGSPAGYDWWPLSLRNPLGAAMAYSSVVVSRFPDISVTRGFEDNIFARRGYLFGDLLYIEDKLIDYRIGSGTTSSGNNRQIRLKISQSMVESTVQNKLDLEYVKDCVPLDKYEEISTLVSEISTTYTLEYKMLDGFFVQKLISFIKYYFHANKREHLTISWMARNYLPLMFPKLFGLLSFGHAKG